MTSLENLTVTCKRLERWSAGRNEESPMGRRESRRGFLEDTNQNGFWHESWGIKGNALRRRTHPGANTCTVGGSRVMIMIDGMGSHSHIHGSHEEDHDQAQKNGQGC